MSLRRIFEMSLLVGALTVPFVESSNYWLHVFSLALIGIVLALGMQLLLGMAGLLSLGQGAFYAVGAYTSALAAAELQAPFLVSFVLAGITAALVSLVLIPIVRLPGTSLAVATLGFNTIVFLVLMNEDWVTGGSMGVMNIASPSIFSLRIDTERASYFLCLTVAAGTYIGIDRLVTSRIGRALMAISQDEDAATSCGISLIKYKMKCFVVAAFTAGLAGSLYAHTAQYINPNDFNFVKSLDILMMVVIGGIGSLPGAIVGSLVVVLTPEFLRTAGEYRLILFGVLVIVLVGVGRGGLAGLASLVGRRLAWKPVRDQPYRDEVSPGPGVTR